MVIAGLGTATPPRRYTQTECWEALQRSSRFDQLAPRSQAILRKVLTGNNGIRTRHLVLDDLSEAFQITPDVLQARFNLHAPGLAAEAASRALQRSGFAPSEIDAVLVSTCTGYLCPGLTSYLIERLNLRPEIFALDLVGQGCGAAIPNLRAAEALISSNRCRKALSVCVEVCSAAFYLDDDPGVLISACLFGDGAGAAVLCDNADGSQLPEWKGSLSYHDPASRDLLRFEHRNGMLRNLLSAQVPALAAEQTERVLLQSLRQHQLTPQQIDTWLFHPGGRDVLNSISQRLNLSQEQMQPSASVLEEYGNLSSSSLFFVMEQAFLGHSRPGYWWMASFGAGFTAHGALWKVDGPL